MHDVIPDIHGDYVRLEHTLRALNYVKSGSSWRHPDGRSVVFLGDFIDTGQENGMVINTVRGRAVQLVAKGPEVRLGEGRGFYDLKGDWREEVRLRWWDGDAKTWRAAALSVPNPDDLPDEPLPCALEFRFYPAEAKPVFVGHYKMPGRPEILARNATCLDYPKVPCAYRWEAGASYLAQESLIVA